MSEEGVLQTHRKLRASLLLADIKQFDTEKGDHTDKTLYAPLETGDWIRMKRSGEMIITKRQSISRAGFVIPNCRREFFHIHWKDDISGKSEQTIASSKEA